MSFELTHTTLNWREASVSGATWDQNKTTCKANVTMELSHPNNMLSSFKPQGFAILGGDWVCKHMEEDSSLSHYDCRPGKKS